MSFASSTEPTCTANVESPKSPGVACGPRVDACQHGTVSEADDLSPPVDEIEECVRSHARVLSSVSALEEHDLRQPSNLPGWSRAHVLSHLALNADSVVRRLGGALRGVVLEQYVGGAAGRAAEIEEAATRSAMEILDHVRKSADDVDTLFASFPEEAWAHPISAVNGPNRPARSVVFARWREVEAHHVDLRLEYQVANWPEVLVARWLPTTLDGLEDRADRRELLAWTLGRGPAPELAPWG